jgi:hypothetical protein
MRKDVDFVDVVIQRRLVVRVGDFVEKPFGQEGL